MQAVGLSPHWRRSLLVTITAAFCLAASLHPVSVMAYSAVVANGYYNDMSGVFGARRSLNKVDVLRTSTAYGEACEDALNNDGSWAQSVKYCTLYPYSNYAYHEFCACTLRLGWNGPLTSNGAWMLGIEYY